MAGKSVKLIYQMARPAHRPKPAVLSVLSTKSATIFDEGSRRKKRRQEQSKRLRPASIPFLSVSPVAPAVPHVGQDSLINHKISWPSSRSSSKSGAIIIFIIWQGEAESVPPLPPPPPPEPFFPLS